MNISEFSLLVFAASLLAGLLGAMTGLGGGVVIIPLLVLAFKVNIHYAIGASLISVIATSSGSAAAYLRKGLTNIRIGMFLEIATTIGAIFGSFLATRTSTKVIASTLGVVLLCSAATSVRKRKQIFANCPEMGIARLLRFDGFYPVDGVMQPYWVCRVPLGFALMVVAGTLSGLLGIGSGAMKVLAMDEAMRIPLKVSTTTSNFMIGVTAAASAGIYWSRGYIEPMIAMPVTLGALVGSMLGAAVLVRSKTHVVRATFAAVIALLGCEMIYSGMTGKI
jgi:hypothetical protein